MVVAWVLYLNRMSDNHRSALNIDMVMTTTQKTEFALLDSGATENFLDPQTMERLQISIQKLSKPRIIYNIDGTLNKAGSITHKTQLQVTFGKETHTVDFFITDLGQDRAVLGFPFLCDFNPNINWNEGTIKPEPQIFVTPVQLWEHRWCYVLGRIGQ